MLCDLTEEVATREKVHDEELVRTLLDASLKRDDAWVLGYELVETYFTEEGTRVSLASRTGDAFDSVVFWVLGG